LDSAREHLESQHHVRPKGMEPGDGMQLPAMMLGVVVGFPQEHHLLPGEPRQQRIGPLNRGTLVLWRGPLPRPDARRRRDSGCGTCGKSAA
jgi:hypothetical protein